MKKSKEDIIEDIIKLGVKGGDTILIRGNLGSIGRLQGGGQAFIDALLTVLGKEGTIVSLAFTGASFIRKPKIEDAFDVNKPSYAGALPNRMLKHPNAKRSTHPMCSYVAIGKNAEFILEGHDETAPAYEPIRKIIQLKGKNILVGCVKDSPGFTTAHLAEYDLGMMKLAIFPQLRRTYYKKENGYKVFSRRDPGLCSNSYYKFYSYYVASELLSTGYIGDAYSILVPSKEGYELEKGILKQNKKFNVCDSPDCFTCNVGRWDRLHKAPAYIMRYIYKKVTGS